ncbi:hypothetical protein FQN54_008114 [Arachnomyces sp. PD_36]|nr:hypothetical protein FQN54_008114 [Arachnomyces sp. PD_36]
MRLFTKEEEEAHNAATLKGGLLGGAVGLLGGTTALLAASRRYHSVRTLTLPLKAFLVSSSGTFTGIIAADHASRSFEIEGATADDSRFLGDRATRLRNEELSKLSFKDRAIAYAREEKYKIIGLTWIASIVGSFAIVGRSPYLTGQQKLVQARVYAQGLTLAVMCATAAFEISDQRKGEGMLDKEALMKRKKKQSSGEKEGGGKNALEDGEHKERYEGEDLWKDMVKGEELRLKEREEAVKAKEERDRKEGKLKKKAEEKHHDEEGKKES